MKHTIICIGRQYGSGGREVGEAVAKRLGLPFYDKLLIQQAARESGLTEETVSNEDERPIGLSEMVTGNPFADTASLGAAFYSENQRVFEAESAVIRELAAKGSCVIIGRCASALLREAGCNVISVFVTRTWTTAPRALPAAAASARRPPRIRPARSIGCAKNISTFIPIPRGARHLATT